MAHPFQFTLQELKIAIDNLVSTIPEDTKKEANRLYEELLLNEKATQEEIHNAIVNIGKSEYSHRHSYHELVDKDSDKHILETVMSNLNPGLKEKVAQILDSGVNL